MRRIESSIVAISAERGFALVDFASVYDALAEPAAPYPEFQSWFYETLVPGINRGQRRLFIAYNCVGWIGGVVIAKRTAAERKLCTVWVSPSWRRHGIAKQLTTDALNWLGTDKPLFTVAEDRVWQFHGLLDAWDFGRPIRVPHLYRKGVSELVFNGTLQSSCRSWWDAQGR
jgi:hypothetical protein